MSSWSSMLRWIWPNLECNLKTRGKLYNSFVPKTTREWNNLPNHIQNAVSNSSFKSCYKKHFFQQANSFYSYEKEKANIHHTRLRLGLSHLRSHLSTYNLINDPLCQQCNLESETIEHYLIRCPSYTIPRIRYLQSLIESYDYNYVSSLSDFDLVDKFLHGDSTLSNTDNLNLFSMAQTYIIDTDRFSFGGQQR